MIAKQSKRGKKRKTTVFQVSYDKVKEWESDSFVVWTPEFAEKFLNECKEAKYSKILESKKK